jgi:hypothetical protein
MMRCSCCLLALALGCTPELEPIHWEAIDVAALRQAIAQPTGTVDEANAQAVGGAIVQRNEPYRVLADYLHTVFVGAESGDRQRQPPWVAPQALAGTSVYLLVACPGPLGDFEQPFTHGSMRVDSPTLDGDVLSTIGVRGQLRLSFAACELGEYMFEGAARAFVDTDPSELGLVPELAVARLDQLDAAYQLREPVLWDAADRVSALFELSSGETLVLDWYVAQLGLRLRGRNGELICTVVDDSLDCMPP